MINVRPLFKQNESAFSWAYLSSEVRAPDRVAPPVRVKRQNGINMTDGFVIWMLDSISVVVWEF